MSRPRTALLRAVAVLLALAGATACAPQRDLEAISGMPDLQMGNRERNRVWGTMSTGGPSVMHRELPQ